MVSSVPPSSDRQPPAPLGCPDCAAALPPGTPARCPACRLPLGGPVAARLWQVEKGLDEAERRRVTLLGLREELLVQLRALRDLPDAPPLAPVWPAPPVAARAGEVSGRSAQTALLVLGGVLVSIAALVFTVVSWGRLGVAGRAAVLFCLTAAALAAPLVLRWRKLFATAETFAGIGVALLLLDGFSLEHLGPGSSGAPGYWAGVTAVVSAGSAAYGWLLRMRVPLFAGFLLGRLPLLLAAHAAGFGDVTGSVTAMAATAALDYAFLRRGPVRSLAPRVVNVFAVMSLVWAATAAAFALQVSLNAGLALAPIRGGGSRVEASLGVWLPLGLLALVALAVSLPRGYPGLSVDGRRIAAGAAGLAAVAAGGGTCAALLPGGWGAVGFGAPAVLLVVAGAARLGRGAVEGRVVPVGLLTVAGAVLTATSAVSLEQLLPGLVEPVAHWRVAWEGSRPPHGSQAAPGAALTALWLLLAAGAAVRVSGLKAATTAAAEAVASGVAAVALALLPVAFGLSPAVAVGFVTALALAGGWFLDRRPALAPGVIVAGVLALLWALADRPSTIVVLALAAALAAVLTGRGRPAPAVTAALAVAALGGEAAAVAVTAGLERPDHLLAVLAVALATAPVAAWLTGRADAAVGSGAAVGQQRADRARLTGRTDPAVAAAVEFAGYGLAALALLLSVDVPGRLSFELAVTGVAALGVGLRADRRRSAPAAGVALLIVASWIWLARQEVGTPEAYSLSLAVAALVFGHLRRRRFAEEGLGPALPISPDQAAALGCVHRKAEEGATAEHWRPTTTRRGACPGVAAPGGSARRAPGSWAVYGPGLAVGLLPSLWALFLDGHWLRPLLLGLAALAVAVLGVRLRLQCPLLLGGGVLVLVAGHELAPTVVQVLGLLPRWVPLAVAGALLLALGATYERRLREARRLAGALRRLG
ncbi:SCO7613 C-terminal domain-containing membrane protein [Kitasatospora sp. NPDC051170]|uniref:SCO7613 C-terminal domain-containing membrane protein n=1 Tax=Kitasatospora sp. NPDC051170 TaxID=3364056 RepID=UPI0037B74867